MMRCYYWYSHAGFIPPRQCNAGMYAGEVLYMVECIDYASRTFVCDAHLREFIASAISDGLREFRIIPRAEWQEMMRAFAR